MIRTFSKFRINGNPIYVIKNIHKNSMVDKMFNGTVLKAFSLRLEVIKSVHVTVMYEETKPTHKEL